MGYNKIEKQVLEKITPDETFKKKVYQVIEELHQRIEEEVKNRKLPVDVQLVGSMAKDTFLKDNLDIDFFLCYPTSFSKEKIAKNTLCIGRKILSDTEESYAEHPYIRGYYHGYKAEIVPCYKIEKASQKLSAVDRTPLHTKYVKEHLKEKQKQDVRLLKQFLRGIGCYGAEAEIEGFSGYLCELLIIKYGDFKNLIKKASKWKNGERISLTKEKNQPDFDSSLVFIDPIDPSRNVASALSKEKFDFFIKACREYLKKPRVTFFFPKPVKPWTLEEIKKQMRKKKMYFAGICFDKPKIIDENLYPQIRKTVKSIKDSASRNGFIVHHATFHVAKDKVYIIIKTDDKVLPETLLHVGPPVKLEKNSRDFLEKWKNDKRVVKGPYEKNGRYLVEIKREHRDIREFLSSELKNLSLGKDIKKIVKSSCEILDMDDLLIDDLREFWTVYLDGKMSWER